MKKVISFLLTMALCLSFGATAFAAEPAAAGTVDDVPYSEPTLIVPEGEPTLFDIPDPDDIPLEDLPDVGEFPNVDARVIPSTANEFKILWLEVHPAVIQDGKYKASDRCIRFSPSTYAPTLIQEKMTLQQQKALIASAGLQEDDVVGWYLTGRIYMDCYIPYYVEYRTYNHESNGESMKAKAVHANYADIYAYCRYPSDKTADYTYGFTGRGVMQVYDPIIKLPDYVYPTYSMKVTFKNS